MYGASATSRHFGGVVLWRLDPLAAGEVLIRAGEHIRGCCTGLAQTLSWIARIRRTSSDKPYTSTFAHAYHNTRSDPDAGADGCAEGSESRPCAGGVILWERALFGWGIKISLGEPASARAKDEKGRPDASTDADILRARRSCPPAVAAGRSGRPEPTKSPAQSRVARAQSADAFRLA